MKTNKQTAPFTLFLDFFALGDDVTSVVMRSSIPFDSSDSRALLGSVLDILLPSDFSCRFAYNNSAVVIGSEALSSTPLTCCPSGSLKMDLSLVVELPDGLVHPITISVSKVEGVRGDNSQGDRRYVRFSGVISVDGDEDEEQ